MFQANTPQQEKGEHMTARRWTTTAMLLLVCSSVGMGCTVVREVERLVFPDREAPVPEPKVVDMLVLVELDRSTAELTEDYGRILGTLDEALAFEQVTVRRRAIAPLYRRTGDAVPLIYGDSEPDEGGEVTGVGEFEDPVDAIRFYAEDDQRIFLREDDTVDGENLARLGQDIVRQSIYRPNTAEERGVQYFGAPEDGFVVVYLASTARRCGHGDEVCQLDGVSAAEYFTRSEADSEDASWLTLPGDTGLPASKIYHLAIATDEFDGDKDAFASNVDAFYERCERLDEFPSSALLFLEPSASRYYDTMTREIARSGGHASLVPMCEALSGREAPKLLARSALSIRLMLD